MAIKKVSKTVSRNRKPEPSYWKVVAIIAVIFSVGLTVKAVFFPTKVPVINPGIASSPSPARASQPVAQTNDPLESQVKLVAANFRCACGGCGELFLVDCTCDMPRGAKEEKTYIREQLEKGLTVDQVVQLVDQKYGHKIM
ncbi:MAG: cytochrome c-type biogenesis protein CcmH [Deltaproteobacteria bacterium]|nr:MAG: cytochrome c-type biogenesis protein CcmH [Deltaproteobacteria bacterium]